MEKRRRLKHIPPERIKRNPENPRIVFRQEEMDSLLISIEAHGIQVPISVYEDKAVFYLIDGERRWRCALKLNLDAIPALVQNKPSELDNLLLMSNIHALREQWDYFTIAKNLARIRELFEQGQGYLPNEVELSKQSGLSRGQIRRCQLLIDLPERYANMLLEELRLPKVQQKLTEDFFIEMEKSLKTVVNRLPEFEDGLDEARDALIHKYRGGIVESVTDFRKLSKIATAVKNIGLKKKKAHKALNRLFAPGTRVGIRELYESTVEFGYDEQQATKQAVALNEFLSDLTQDQTLDNLDKEFVKTLRLLLDRLKKLLGAR